MFKVMLFSVIITVGGKQHGDITAKIFLQRC